ncbi:hypothetical protein C8A00DRAFT_34996 [Chaetomidium leptoderma]|uniref:Uncharacterized protein n=1 Tax=Chaetomidium leptoderma TaxID=669021 RepID=A0AAN6ZXC2_9PEZI|nr:hypothetical protein C8A00DRAFT_34996 [Chaetomidium leptoderma]
MARNTTLSARALLLLASGSLLLSCSSAQSTCFNALGVEDTNQQPCFASGATDTSATTWCCNKNDQCLSNGLCLSPGSNNLMTQQGCTDKDWGGSCTKFCPARGGDQTPDKIALIPCPASYDGTTNDIKFCCGPDPTACCEKPSSWITLPAATIIRESTTSSSSSSSESSNSYSLKIGLGIGLGIGIPILLVLIAVAYLLAQPLHARRRSKRNNNKNKSGGGGKPTLGGGTNTEKTSSSSAASDDQSYATFPHPRSHRRDRHRRRKSFGQVDTRICASTDDGGGDDDGGVGGVGHHHHWHSAAAAGTAAPTALAQWARSPFGFGGMEPPPKEMEGRGVSGSSRLGAAELASSEVVDLGASEEGGRRMPAWKGRGVRVAAEEVELPTPDTPADRLVDVEKGLGNGGVGRS